MGHHSQWTLLRMGHTTTGKDNHPAPVDGRGLECDKLSKQAAEAMFEGLMGKLISDSRPLVGEGKTLVSTHIDSWEVGSQNWTPKFREEFHRLCGYDPMPLLPAMCGRVVDSVEVTERFFWGHSPNGFGPADRELCGPFPHVGSPAWAEAFH
jgi:hypothetical protein